MGKEYEGKTYNGKKVVGRLGFQATIWGEEKTVLIGHDGEIYQIIPDSLKCKEENNEN